MSTTPAVTLELKALLRRVKVGRCLDTLPERLALAHAGGDRHGQAGPAMSFAFGGQGPQGLRTPSAGHHVPAFTGKGQRGGPTDPCRRHVTTITEPLNAIVAPRTSAGDCGLTGHISYPPPRCGHVVTPLLSDQLASARHAQHRPTAGSTARMAPEALFDGEHLSRWKMAGVGGFDLARDSLVTRGGMGLLWYAARQFGDFTLEVDWRASTPMDNSGVFLRFPQPGDDPWVAVREGYEIQIQTLPKSRQNEPAPFTSYPHRRLSNRDRPANGTTLRSARSRTS